MERALIHTAGICEEGSQACSVCGYLLHRGTEFERNLPGFPAGAQIYVLEDGLGHRALWSERHVPARFKGVEAVRCDDAVAS